MSYISDKIAEVRGLGHVVPEGIEELFLAIESEIGLKDKQKPEDEPVAITDQSEHHNDDLPENPLDGERVDS